MPPSGPPHPLPRGGLRTLLRHLTDPDQPHHLPGSPTGALLLAQEPQASGETNGQSGPQAALWLRDGLVYSATLTTFTPPMALRLKTAGCLSDEAYATLAGLPADEVGPHAVAHCHVAPTLVEELHRELLLATVSHLFDWKDAAWVYQPKDATTCYVTSGMTPALVAGAVDERIGQWRAVTRNYPQATQPTSVPTAGPAWAAKAGAVASPEMAALLTQVDGTRTIAKIATACGFTRFEVTRLIAQAVADRILAFPTAHGTGQAEVDLADEAAPRRSGPATAQELRQAEAQVQEARLALRLAEAHLESLQVTRPQR